MTNYTELENLSDEDILNTYDDVVLISAYQYHCLCKCQDGYSINYTCYNISRCRSGEVYAAQLPGNSQCEIQICNTHGGTYSIINMPDSGDPCCSSGSSCWRYSITEW